MHDTSASQPTPAPVSAGTPSAPAPTNVDSPRYPLRPAGPSTEAFRDLKTAINQLHAAVRRWSTRTKSLQEPIKGALRDVVALDEQLHALWVHLDRVLRDLPPAIRGTERTAWRRPRHPFPDLTGEFPRSVRQRAHDELED